VCVRERERERERERALPKPGLAFSIVTIIYLIVSVKQIG